MFYAEMILFLLYKKAKVLPTLSCDRTFRFALMQYMQDFSYSALSVAGASSAGAASSSAATTAASAFLAAT